VGRLEGVTLGAGSPRGGLWKRQSQIAIYLGRVEEE
jgi:hypothetical protein